MKNIFKIKVLVLIFIFILLNTNIISAISVLAIGSEDGTIVIWDTKTWNKIRILKGYSGIYSVAFNKTVTYLAAADLRGVTIVWDISDKNPKNWKEIKTLKGDFSSSINSVAFNNDGTYLATGSDDNTTIWDTNIWKQVTTLSGHGGITSVAFNNDGTYLATGSKDGGTIVWDISGRNPKKWKEITILKDYSRIYSVAFNNDGTCLATGSRGGLMVWDTKTWKEMKTLKKMKTLRDHDICKSVAFNKAGTYLATGSNDNTTIWDTNTWKKIITLSGHTDLVNSVAFNNDGTYLATGSESEDDTIIIWNVSDRNPKKLNILNIFNRNPKKWKKIKTFSYTHRNPFASCRINSVAFGEIKDDEEAKEDERERIGWMMEAEAEKVVPSLEIKQRLKKEKLKMPKLPL